MQPKEILLRKTIPVVINSFNQPTYLKNILNKFELNYFKNFVILDNASTNTELIDYYKHITDFKNITVIYYNNNNGPRYFHLNGIYKIFNNIPHLYTDPDLDFDALSDSFLTYLFDLSNKYRIAKVGSALEIPDSLSIKPDIFFNSPANNLSVALCEWESQFWEKELETKVFLADIDTTLHLFNPEHYNNNFFSAVRVAHKGFIVKHLPWYKNDFMPVDEKNYYKNSNTIWSNY